MKSRREWFLRGVVRLKSCVSLWLALLSVLVLGAMGLTYATFGNHEFDLKRESFLERLWESRFIWFSSNVRDAEGYSRVWRTPLCLKPPANPVHRCVWG